MAFRNRTGAVFTERMVLFDGVGSDFVASDPECGQNNSYNIAKRQDSMVKGKPKLTKSKSSMTTLAR